MWHPQFKFPESLKYASTDERITYFEKEFILKHAMIQLVQDELKSSFLNSSEQQIALVIGPTGVGKSCLAHAIFKEAYKSIPEGEFNKNLPMIYFEADVNSTGGFSWKNFYKRLLQAIGELEDIRVYGKPQFVGEHGARKYSARNRTEHDLRQDLEHRLSEYCIQYILFDEIQHVFKYGGNAAERNLDILKSISNKTGCQFIGLGTYETSFSVDKSAQLSRRIMTIEFPGYSMNSSDEYQSFLSAYMGLLAHIPLQISEDVAQFSKEAYIGCCGCIGILKEWFNRALRRALNEEAQLSAKNFRDTRLKGSQLKSIAEEISEGKMFFIEPNDNEIMILLGVSEQKTVEKVLLNSSKKTVKPGVRRPGRDPVL
jgi:energy-coupling factor transporter ATP-binding protein EcfA2